MRPFARPRRGAKSRFRRFVDDAADGFYLCAGDGEIVDVNEAGAASLGYSCAELVGMSVYDVVVTATPANFERYWDPAFSLPVTVEGIHRRKDGATYPVETRLSLMEADGEQLLLALARDSSRRVETERALRFQAKLLDQVDAAVVATDLDGIVTHWNQGATRLMGWTADHALGKRAEELEGWSPRAAATLPEVRRRVARGHNHDMELTLTRRDGSRFDAYLTASPVRDDDGELLGMVGVAVDISERKFITTELAKRAEQQAAVAELGRLVLTGAGTEALMRRSVEVLQEALGAEYPSVLELLPGRREVVLRAASSEDESLVGKMRLPVTEGLVALTLAQDGPVVIPDLAAETRFRPASALLERGVRSSVAVTIEGKDGAFGLLGVHTRQARTFSADDLNFVSAVANVLGAAVTREREEQLEHQLQRVRRLESVGQLAGGVAHDFNNLLAVILNFAEFALDEAEKDSGLYADIDQIRRAAERAAGLTRQLLVFSRREPVQVRVVDVNEALAGTEEMLRRTIGEHIELRSDPGPDLWPTRAGGGQLEQVFVNLAVNGRDAMPDGGRLTIRTRNTEMAPPDLPRGRWVHLTVEDTGGGMHPSVAAQAFDPFFTTKPKGQGTGLGLASVFGIVSQAGGEVRIDSQLGEGTRVSIWLPATEGSPPTADRGAGSPSGHGETILVVEDEEQVRALTSRILAEHGYEVFQAANGEAALHECASRLDHVDLMVTDVVMPGMSGAELAERLLEARPDMKVLYMSGYTSDVVLRHAPRDSAVAVLEKPFSAEELLCRVRECLHARVSL
ncbi:MAG TPA: PAS domain S-box protein [Thermoleophilaceae bacterium]|nr:PAS domain S-box protein [Thermoleophilaceae bacterium]